MRLRSFLCLITPLCSYLYGYLYGGLYERAHIIRYFPPPRVHLRALGALGEVASGGGGERGRPRQASPHLDGGGTITPPLSLMFV